MMRLLQLLMIVIVSGAIHLPQAAAQQPDIVGTWSTKADILLETNDKVVKVPRELSILIEKMDGNYFTGSRSWKALTNAPVMSTMPSSSRHRNRSSAPSRRMA